jgi:hypothetical protein
MCTIPSRVGSGDETNYYYDKTSLVPSPLHARGHETTTRSIILPPCACARGKYVISAAYLNARDTREVCIKWNIQQAGKGFPEALEPLQLETQGRRSRSGWSGHGLTTFDRSFGKGRWCYMCALHASGEQWSHYVVKISLSMTGLTT